MSLGGHYSAYHAGLEARQMDHRAGTLKLFYAWHLARRGEDDEHGET